MQDRERPNEPSTPDERRLVREVTRHVRREHYRQGLPGYHDPTANIGGATPALSALTLRLWLAGFGVAFCAVAAVLAARAGFGWGAVVLGALAVISLIDLGWVAYRKWRGEPH